MDSLRFFNPYEEIRFTENLLPHWQQKGATYFITFRLGDSIPTHLRTQWEEERATWLRFHPEPGDPDTEQEYHKRFTGAIERWLDAGHGSCVLWQNECARIVDDALRHFDGDRLALASSVVDAKSRPRALDPEPNTSSGRFASELENVHFAQHQSVTRTFRDFVAAKLL
jgi:putative transposase